MIPSLLTLMFVGMLIAGLKSLRLLHRLGEPTRMERSDPFYTSISLLFSTAPRSEEFRSRQRRTIWFFCAALLFLYLARVAFVMI